MLRWDGKHSRTLTSRTTPPALTHHPPATTLSTCQGLICPNAMARLSVGEALTNLVWARATSLPDVRASVNWMYAAKMKSEGVAMYDAAETLR